MNICRNSVLFVLLALLTRAAIAQVNAVPQTAVVVLRNGNLLEGRVTEAGEILIVAFGKAGELRVKATDVEFVCADLQEAYARKAAGLNDVGARQHLDLAEWCLRHRLNERAAEQIVEAVRIEPEHPRIAGVEARLRSAAKSATPSSAAAEPAPNVEDWDQREKELPRGVTEKFTTAVQPMLFNRCAMNGCHGPGSSATWHISRPPTGNLAQRRGTQRNLFATLGQIDRRNPDESPLLTRPLATDHAGGPLFDRQTRIQWEQLAAWVRSTAAPAEPTAPATIVQPVTHLSQPAEEKHAEKQPKTSPSPSADGKFAPRDPFDPEIFNRRMHPDRAKRTQP